MSQTKFEELKNRFAEKNIDMSKKLVEHFTNLVYSSGKSEKTQSEDVKKAMIKALKKVEDLLP